MKPADTEEERLERLPFTATFGRLPYSWLIVGVTVVAGFAEGVGLALFVPLIEIMSGADKEPTRIFVFVRDAFGSIGAPMTLFSMLGGITVLIVTAFGLIYLQRALVVIAKNRYVRELRAEVAHHLLHASWPFLARRSTGDIVNQLIVESNRAGVGLMVQAYFVAAAIQVAVLVGMTAALSWQLIVVAAAFALVMILVSRPLVARAARIGKETNIANKSYGTHVVDFFKGAKLIKVTASEIAVGRRIDHFNQSLYRVYRDYELNAALTHFLLQATPVLFLAGLIAIAYEFLALEASYILVVLLLLARIAPRVADMQQRYEDYKYNIPGFAVIDRMKRACAGELERLNADRPPFEGLRDSIRLEHVSFHHDAGGSAAVDDVSIRIGRREMVAIVGASGAGKSTLIDLIAGLHNDYDGEIYVDDIELRDLNKRSWRQKIGYVTQDVIVFDDTLRSNLMFVRPGATDAEIEDALRVAHFGQVVSDMPEGLDTPMNEGGVRLSGGQRQRLALARAVLSKPELLLLDEATSALDSETESVVHRAIEDLRHQLTVVVIAHRLSTVRNADRIYVMEQGRVVETGSYDELLARKGRFAALHDLQFA